MKYISLLWMIGLLASCGRSTETARPQRKDVSETVFASGNLEARGTFSLSAQTDGYIVSLPIGENDVVEQNAVVAVIDNRKNQASCESANTLLALAHTKLSENSPHLQKLARDLEKAHKQMAYDALQAERYETLWSGGSISKQEYETRQLQFETSRLSYEAARQTYREQQMTLAEDLAAKQSSKKANDEQAGFNLIRSVKRARIYTKLKEEGDYVRVGDVIATLGDPEDIYASVSIDEGSIRKVRTGQSAAIRLNIDKEKIYRGTVEEILPSFDEATQSYTAKIRFLDSLDFKIVNTQLQVNIQVAQHADALVIPLRFLSTDHTVRVQGEKTARMVKVKIISDTWVVVDSGLTEDDVIVLQK